MKLNSRRSCFYTLILIAWSSFAMTNDTRLDVRELCRKRVAGKYLSVLDELNHAKGLARSSGSKLKSLSARIRTSQTKTIMLKRRVRTKNFDNKEFREYHNSKKEVESLLFAQNQARNAFTQSKKRVKDKQKVLKSMAAKIKKVFNIKVGKRKTPGYNIRISYIHPCKKYRLNCKLPQTQIHALAEIFSGTTPKECSDYIAKISSKKRMKN